MTTEILVTTDTELLVDDSGTDLLVETLVEREQLVEEKLELLIEELPSTDILVEQAPPEFLVAEVEIVELLEVGMQGPPGPRGATGPMGPSGVSTVGGFDVAIEDPQPGDVLALNVDMEWMNEHVMDGGNF